jgi:hypothetical protein
MAAALVSQPVGPEFESSAVTMQFKKKINALFYKSNIYLNLTRHSTYSRLPEKNETKAGGM